jgi:hypothetical protein
MISRGGPKCGGAHAVGEVAKPRSRPVARATRTRRPGLVARRRGCVQQCGAHHHQAMAATAGGTQSSTLRSTRRRAADRSLGAYARNAIVLAREVRRDASSICGAARSRSALQRELAKAAWRYIREAESGGMAKGSRPSCRSCIEEPRRGPGVHLSAASGRRRNATAEQRDADRDLRRQRAVLHCIGSSRASRRAIPPRSRRRSRTHLHPPPAATATCSRRRSRRAARRSADLTPGRPGAPPGRDQGDLGRLGEVVPPPPNGAETCRRIRAMRVPAARHPVAGGRLVPGQKVPPGARPRHPASTWRSGRVRNTRGSSAVGGSTTT